MSVYFQNFPIIQYDVYGDGTKIDLIDISRAIRLKKSLKDDVILYTYYNIQDGERPDHVSQKLYGSQNYYWTFFMVNENLTNVFDDWPLSRAELENKIIKKYSGYVAKTNEDISNKFIKNETLIGLISGAKATIIEKDTNIGLVKITNINGTFTPGEILRGMTSNDIFTLDVVIPFALAPHHYEDSDGNIVQRALNTALITNTDYEINENEKKSKLKVIRREYINTLTEEFFKQINPEEE